MPIVVRITLGLLSIGLCLFLIQASARFGFSRLLGRYALITNSIPVADEAIRLSPYDPEAHRAHALVLNHLKMPAEASKSLEQSVTLRPRDDRLWLELGQTREELGDTEGALAAMDQAVSRAPFYAHTHWQRGNLLLRMGRPLEAFAELRSAASANPAYLPNLVDLAWGISGGDIKTTADLIQINDDTKRLALIRFLARKGNGKDVIDQLALLATPLSAENKTEVVRLLLASRAFRAAFELLRGSENSNSPMFINGGFEEPLVLNDIGFGWIVSPESKNRLAIDVSEKLEGTKSLQISFDGDWTPGTPLLSQTIIVEPSKTYRVSFAVKTKDLATGGPPLITAGDAGNNELLGKSENFPVASSWLPLSFEFTTSPNTTAVIIRLQRNSCETAQCPIFGTLWLDQFHIAQIQSTIKP